VQCVKVCCSVLQCVAVCCSLLQCVTKFHTPLFLVHALLYHRVDLKELRVAVCCSVLQCAAVCCSVLQFVAVCCSVLQCVTKFHTPFFSIYAHALL